MLCAGSERLEAGLPEEDSDESKEGTLLHKCSVAGGALADRPLKTSQRDLLEINAYLIREVFERVTNQFGLEAVADSKGFEQEFWLHRGIKAMFPGHIDLYEYTGSNRLLVILDYKFGYREVSPAAANPQLRSYAVMGAELHDCDHVVVAITQPRLPREDRITMAVYSRDDIAAARQQLYDIWDRKELANKNPNILEEDLVAGDEQCRYCKAKLFCPAYQKMMQQGLALVPNPNGQGTVAKRQADAEQSLAQLSDVDLGRVLDAIQFADFLKDRARDVARERIAAGSMTGWKLGKEKEKRTVTDPFQAAQILKEAGLPIEKIMASCKMSLGDDGGVAGIYREAKGGTWKDANDGVNNLLASVIERSPMKPSITRDTKALKE